ncbi:hypothetical protein BH20ACT7_BH20ACT7_14140 [soil metagenome]
MRCWEDAEPFLIDRAAENLRAGDEVLPCLVAFAGDDRLLVAWLRAFAKGAYADPLTELLALAVPLGADRLAVSFGGRATSLADPVPPVCDGVGDLRQRVVCIERADACGQRAHPSSAMLAFDLVDGQVEWGQRLEHDGQTGWINAAMAAALQGRQRLQGTPRQIRKQARRCDRLGHQIVLAPAALTRLNLTHLQP